MRIIICPDKFKGSLSAKQVCAAIEAGIHQGNSYCNITQLPLADGGEGTLEVLQSVLGGEMIQLSVFDPLFRPILADYLWIETEKKAFIEMSRASGLALLESNERNPLKTTSYGTGQLIKHAMELGAKQIVLTIGGSATNDAGIGMAAALGYQFLNKQGEVLSPIGENLLLTEQIIPSGLFPDSLPIDFQVATDVENPLYGLQGAAYIFAEQKGANPDEIKYLDNCLINIARFFDQSGKITEIPGAGAAGGLGAGAMYFLKADKISGANMVLDAVNFDQHVQKCDLVITGEGKIDEQTWYGKLVAEVLRRTQKANKKAILVCGIQEHKDQTPVEFKQIPVLEVATKATNTSDSIQYAGQYLQEFFIEKTLSEYLLP